MQVSLKCQYTLRSLYELAKKKGGTAGQRGEIAQAQAIPPRFLELILQGLKNDGQIESRRGNRGGYVLAVAPREITVGSIIRAVDGTLSPVRCLPGAAADCCPMQDACVFQSVWQRAQRAVEEIYDSTTLQDLLDEAAAAPPGNDYCV